MDQLSFILGHFEHENGLNTESQLRNPVSVACKHRHYAIFRAIVHMSEYYSSFFEDRKDQLQVKLYTSLSIQPPSELLQVAATFVIRTPTAILPSALLPSSSVPQVFRLLQPIHSHTDLARRSHRQPYQGTHDASAVSNISGTDFQAAYIATKPWLNFFQAHKLLKKK